MKRLAWFLCGVAVALAVQAAAEQISATANLAVTCLSDGTIRVATTAAPKPAVATLRVVK